MNQPANVIQLKPTTKLKLKLLPPIEQEQISQEKIINFYTDLIKILVNEN